MPVGVLGATGMVGQRLIALLQDHPWFQLGGLFASERSAGRELREAARWLLPGPPYLGERDGVGRWPVLPVDPTVVRQTLGEGALLLSALPTDVAREQELALAQAGHIVLSNASAYRQHPLVPLLFPEVNLDHLALADHQPWAGRLICNPNCTATPLVAVLAPLHRAVGVEAVTVASYQSVSGAGYPGESAWDLLGNVRPHPGDEEQKLTLEPRKMLGQRDGAQVIDAPLHVSARCVRVPVLEGHLVAVHLRTRTPLSPDDALDLLRAPGRPLDLPSAPHPLLRHQEGRDRPNPRWDADAGQGMAVTFGRVEACPVLGLKLFALAHNTLRGAAGAALLNAEAWVARAREQALARP